MHGGESGRRLFRRNYGDQLGGRPEPIDVVMEGKRKATIQGDAGLEVGIGIAAADVAEDMRIGDAALHHEIQTQRSQDAGRVPDFIGFEAGTAQDPAAGMLGDPCTD